MIMLKAGAKLAGMRAEVVFALIAAERIYGERGHHLVVTEVTGGKHNPGSLHYVGSAVDLRTRDVEISEVREISAELREALGADYDVVVEADHLHVEFQPK